MSAGRSTVDLVLLIDCSASMVGEPLEGVRAAVDALLAAVRSDYILTDLVSLSVIAFASNAHVLCEGVDVRQFYFPNVMVGGHSCLRTGLDAVEDLPHGSTSSHSYAPLVAVFTDGRIDSLSGWEHFFRTSERRRNTLVCIAGPKGDDTAFRKAAIPYVRISDLHPNSFTTFLDRAYDLSASAPPASDRSIGSGRPYAVQTFRYSKGTTLDAGELPPIGAVVTIQHSVSAPTRLRVMTDDRGLAGPRILVRPRIMTAGATEFSVHFPPMHAGEIVQAVVELERGGERENVIVRGQCNGALAAPAPAELACNTPPAVTLSAWLREQPEWGALKSFLIGELELILPSAHQLQAAFERWIHRELTWMAYRSAPKPRAWTVADVAALLDEHPRISPRLRREVAAAWNVRHAMSPRSTPTQLRWGRVSALELGEPLPEPSLRNRMLAAARRELRWARVALTAQRSGDPCLSVDQALRAAGCKAFELARSSGKLFSNWPRSASSLVGWIAPGTTHVLVVSSSPHINGDDLGLNASIGVNTIMAPPTPPNRVLIVTMRVSATNLAGAS